MVKYKRSRIPCGTCVSVYLDDGEYLLHVVPGMELDDGDDLGELTEQVLSHVLVT